MRAPIASQAGWRAAWVRVHRYAGLLTALFLAVAGLTGSILAFGAEIDAWLNPHWFRVESRGTALDLDQLARRIEQADPAVQVDYITYDGRAGHAAFAFVSPRPARAVAAAHASYNQVFIDPVGGAILGKRQRGACCLEAAHFVPFMLEVHRSLFIPGAWGRWLMGGIALVWLLDCFVGAYLTLPRSRPRLRKWRPAWQIKRHAGSYRLNFDLHRAGGLWPWGLLLVLALSSVYLNLRTEVFQPVVEVFSAVSPFPESRAPAAARDAAPVLTFETARQRANRYARGQGWPSRVSGVTHFREQGTFLAMLWPAYENRGLGLGNPLLFYDAHTGGMLKADVPGTGSWGDRFMALQFPLHSGQIAGLPGKILICLSGLLVAMLSVTGVLIWQRKRQARPRALAAAGLPSLPRGSVRRRP